MTAHQDPRSAATALISLWTESHTFPDLLMSEAGEHRAVVRELFYGTIRHLRTMEWILRQYAAREPAADVQAALLIGLYELLYMTSVPDHVAIHGAVARVKESSNRHAAPFVNGVLRSIQRDRDRLAARLKKAPDGVRLSHPDILIDRWTGRYGTQRTEALCEWNNGVPDTVVHVNSLRTTRDEFASILQSAGITAAPHPFAPNDSFVIPHGLRINDLPGFATGLFCVRDPATTCAVTLLDPQPGEWILDACAAPGGKAALIAERIRNHGSISAVDLSAERLERVKENAARMGLTCILPLRADATDPAALEAIAEHGRFDRILIDVPCTNTGVLRRRPDARWRFSDDFLARAVQLQRAILDSTAQVLAPRGVLVYSTCSLEPEEGRTLLDTWLCVHPDFRLTQEVSLFPPESGTDGMYAARLEKA